MLWYWSPVHSTVLGGRIECWKPEISPVTNSLASTKNLVNLKQMFYVIMNRMWSLILGQNWQILYWKAIKQVYDRLTCFRWQLGEQRLSYCGSCCTALWKFNLPIINVALCGIMWAQNVKWDCLSVVNIASVLSCEMRGFCCKGNPPPQSVSFNKIGAATIKSANLFVNWQKNIQAFWWLIKGVVQIIWIWLAWGNYWYCTVYYLQ